MKRKSLRTYQSFPPSLWSAKQITESSSTNGQYRDIQVKNKRNSVHYVNLKQAIQKLETDISNRYSKEFVHKTKQEVIEKIVFPYGNNIYVQSRLKGAVSRQSSSVCLILLITRPQSLWNLKQAKNSKLHVNDKIRDLRQTNMSPEHYF